MLGKGDLAQWVRHRGWALVGYPGPLWAGPLWAPWPLWAGLLWAPWALVGRAWALVGWAIVGAMGPCGPCPCGPPGPCLALVGPLGPHGRALVGPLGPHGLGLYGPPWALMGWALIGLPELILAGRLWAT